jgi:hypothetical protein
MKGDSMKKRSLLAEMTGSEITATLEALSYAGVVAEGAAKLRSPQLSSVFKRQLAAIINAGSFNLETVLKPFTRFDAWVRDTELSELWRQKEYKLSIDFRVGCKYPWELENVLPNIAMTTEDFIVLSGKDFQSFPPLDHLLTNEFLSKWSSENLLGIRLKLCRGDAAPYIVPKVRRMIPDNLKYGAMICSAPDQERGGILGLQLRGEDMYLLRHSTNTNAASCGTLIFSYEYTHK